MKKPRSFIIEALRRLTLLSLAAKVLVIFWIAIPPAWRACRIDPEMALHPTYEAELYDRFGNLYMVWPEDGFGSAAPYRSLGKYLPDAVVAREDQRFWKHGGVDLIGLARALVVDLIHREIRQGGSTVEMQLAEMSYSYPQNSMTEKLRAKVFEIIAAWRIDRFAERSTGSKREAKELILASYLGRIDFKYPSRGIREVAYYYFGKKPEELMLGESAYLAGTIRAPEGNDVYRNLSNALAARDGVIRNMVKLEMISEDADDRFFALSKPKIPKRRGDGFTSEAVRREIDALCASGMIPEGSLVGGRIEIHLTCDFSVQDEARRSVIARLSAIESSPGFHAPRGRLQAAVVVIDNATGGILASVGGRNFDVFEFDCALQGKGEFASAGKPFVYAAWMDAGGFDARTPLSNLPLSRLEADEIPGIRSPRETAFLGPGSHPAWKGLAYSSNRMTLRAGVQGGDWEWNSLVRRCRLSDRDLERHTASWLGSFAVRPVDAAAAYAVFPNEGIYHPPYLIERIQVDEKIAYERRPEGNRVIRTETAREITRSLREVLRVGTASRHGGSDLARRLPLAGKTGTYDGSSDCWFVGYGTEITMAVWVGFPDANRTILPGATGAGIAFPIWKRVMENLPSSYSFGTLPALSDLTVAESPRGGTAR